MGKNGIQEQVMETTRRFLRDRIETIASKIDQSNEFPEDNVREMGKLGLLGIPYPEDHGGVGLDCLTYVTVIREIAKACASTAMTVLSHSTLASNPIFEQGDAEQKSKYLRPLLGGESIGAFALTEPNAGSDITAIETTAIQSGEHYVLNGSKVYITNANVADLFVVAAKTAPDQGAIGISLFILERGMSGFSCSGVTEKKLGMRGSDTGSLFFDDVRVPQENLLGRKGLGLKILHSTLVMARIGMASIALGIAEGAQALCLEYVKQRRQFGQHLYRFQSIKNKLADMEVGIRAAEQLIRQAAQMKDAGEQPTKAASVAKLFASEMSMAVTKDAVQIFGAYGYSQDYPLERFFRDAKITEIADGTSEIQRLIIADEIVKQSR
jgi:butyryl-CoA dehydrogenase/acyl-CoA dehydrogenase